jgi:hypothetical protein
VESIDVLERISFHIGARGGPRWLSRYSDSLQAGRSGDRIPVGARFSAPVQTGIGAHPASCTMGTGSFLGVKWAGREVDHPLPSSAEVKERVQLYLYSPSGPSWSVLRWTLRFTLLGHAMTQLVKTLRYKPEGRGFDSRWGHCEFSVTLSFRSHCMAFACSLNLCVNLYSYCKCLSLKFYVRSDTSCCLCSLSLPEARTPSTRCLQHRGICGLFAKGSNLSSAG